jgi:hypothetical protein
LDGLFLSHTVCGLLSMLLLFPVLCFSSRSSMLPPIPHIHYLAFLRSRIFLCPFAMVRAGGSTIERINLHRIKKWIPQFRFLSKSPLSAPPCFAMCRALHLSTLHRPVAPLSTHVLWLSRIPRTDNIPAQQSVRKTDAVGDNRQPGYQDAHVPMPQHSLLCT